MGSRPSSGLREPAKLSEVIGLYERGWSQRRIAAQFGVGQRLIGTILQENGVVARKPEQIDRAVVDESEVRRLFGLSWTAHRIAERLGVAPSTVQRRLYRMGLEVAPETPRPPGRFSIFRDPEVLQKAVDLYGSGLSMDSVAKRLGVSQAAVWRAFSDAGIEGRGRGETSSINIDRNELERLYCHDHQSIPEVASVLGVSTATVIQRLNDWGKDAHDAAVVDLDVDLVRELVDDGRTDIEIARRLGTDPFHVVGFRFRADIRRKRRTAVDCPPVEELTALAGDRGAVASRVAAHYKVSWGMAMRWLQDAGLHEVKAQRSVPGHITGGTADQMSAMYVSGMSIEELGNTLGISKSTVAKELKSNGTPIRQDRNGNRSIVLLDELYSDATVMGVLRSEGVAVNEQRGFFRDRWREPAHISDAGTVSLYVTAGLSSSHISHLTGLSTSWVRDSLFRSGERCRPPSRSPWQASLI